ncbi:MAG: OmpA/MotB domain protein [Deltaproteobacteria bacterium]|nr:OmpA/MotB domain protein [Deltaproteobacteria bacterium]MBP2684002.1 OmpA/MotB domain protein [Deltaproteobacteria bacterium]MBP2686795.1 OmpA/MotB domain protein [Deltaproteobacteria bacterium]
MTRRSFVLPIVLLLLAAACATPPKPHPSASRDVIVLLPDDQGKTGAIVVSSAGVERRLDRPGQSVTVEAGSPPGLPTEIPGEEIRAIAGPALAALPKPPARFILYFHHDSVNLTAESRAILQNVLVTIRDLAPVDVSVVGHTDTVGKKEYNYALSMKRAKAVASILLEKGIDPSVLDITSHGKDNPLVPTGDQVPEPRNRRVEITVR